MTEARFRRSTLGFARRQLIRSLKSPALALPPLLFPLFLLAAFAGGMSGLGAIPTFGYPDYTTFQFVWVLMVGVAMSGMAAGLALAGDFDTKFDRRMLLATGERTPILAGYTLAGVLRAIVTGVLLFAVGLAAGMEVSGNALELAGLIALVLLFALAVTLWSIGFVFRMRSMKAAPLLQTPVLMAMFALPVYTPRPLLAGWVQAVADVNPLTPILEAGRGLIIGDPVRVPLAFGIAVALVAVFGVWAFTGLRSAETPGGARTPRKARRVPAAAATGPPD
ncbi:MAG: ABC transporter permease [Actinobacteria bacterium]|nr:ABC transporter permease [Actinomycetota bacterium]